ncbi:unnamed protein product [Trichobilharzia szidati]|nr:unnamed protein product [Trichobilharzia szidati]
MLMDLFIETLTGLSFELHVSPAETIMSVKSKIQRAEGIPITQQHLIWQNDELDDHRRLRDYSITEGSTLRLVLGLRGGPLNAHRIPPLRLAPIHLSQTALPRFPSRFGSTCNNGFMHPSILTPLVKPNSLQSQNTNSTGVCNAKMRKSEQMSQKTDTERFKLGETKGDNLPIIDCALKLEPIEVSANTQLRNSATSSDSTLETKESGIDPSTGFQISSVNTNTSVDPESNEHNSNNGNNTLQASEEAVSMTITSQNTIDAFSSIDATCSVTSCERSAPKVSTVTSDNSTIPIACHNLEAKPDSFSRTHKEELSDFPPLLSSVHSSEKYYPIFEAPELPSLCRLFETHDNSVLTSAKHSKAEISEGINTAKESDNENTIIVHEFNLLDDGESEKSKSTAAFLSNLLAKVIPSQTRCTDYRERVHYPYQWLRKASPLLEENEEPNPFANSGFFDGRLPDEDSDASAANVFETDTDRDEDDGDDDDDDSKRSYSSVLEQDDNLAELEDYLFHQQVEELFGSPFISSGYPPCSYYTFRDSFGVKQCHSRGNLDSVENGTTGLDGLNQADSYSSFQECDQLTEKVNNLKTEMKKVRIRRQNLHQNDKETVCVTCKEGSLTEDQSSDAFKREESSKGDDKNVSTAKNCTTLSLISESASSSSKSLKDVPETTRSPPEGIGNRIRQRRYATVTPPDVNFLIKTNSSQDKYSVTNDSTLLCIPDSEGIPRNLENNNPRLSPRLIGGYWYSSKNHAPAMSVYLNKELKQFCDSIKQSRLPYVDSLQCNKTPKPVTSHSLSPTVSCLSVLKVTADELKPHSSPPTFLPNLGNPASIEDFNEIVEIEVNKEIVFRCKVLDFQFGSDGELDPLCKAVVDSVNNAY